MPLIIGSRRRNKYQKTKKRNYGGNSSYSNATQNSNNNIIIKSKNGNRSKLNNYTKRILSKPEEFTKYWANFSSQISDDDNREFTASGNASTYGYMKVGGFQTLLNNYHNYINSQITTNNIINNRPIRTFYDLGCGLGMPNIMATLFIPNLEHSIGIELSTQRTQNANIILDKFKRNFSNFGNKVQFINGSILSDEFNYENADLIWISSLCFNNTILEQLTTKLNNELKPGTHIFTSKELPNLKVSYHNKIELEMSWTPSSSTNHYVI